MPEVLEPGGVVVVPQPDIVLEPATAATPVRISQGIFTLADESDGSLAVHARWLLRAIALGRTDLRVCHVGGGTFVMPRLMGAYAKEQVILELHAGIADYADRVKPEGANWTVVVGDYVDTLPAQEPFDVIFYDVPVLPDRSLLAAAGKITFFQDDTVMTGV